MDKESITLKKTEAMDELTKNANFNHCCELIAESLIKYKTLEYRERKNNSSEQSCLVPLVDRTKGD